MKKPENINISLQLVKDPVSRELGLNIEFDQDAPNFFRDKAAISWSPTAEELDFISEAFEIFSYAKDKRQEQTGDADSQKHTSRPVTRETDETVILDRVLEKKRTNY